MSLGFLIARTLALALYTAKITDESKKPIDVIRDVPRQSYTKELTRFTEEIVNSEIALSGMQFFFMTRKLILSVGKLATKYTPKISIQSDSNNLFTGCWSNNYI